MYDDVDEMDLVVDVSCWLDDEVDRLHVKRNCI
jgi:hypothetical protein